MPRSSSASSPQVGASGRQRLPVNPRRNKVPPERRKRVATACNNCNVRRTKCTGQTPCLQCSLDLRECVYPTPVEKVTVTKTEWESLQQRCVELEALVGRANSTTHTEGGRTPGEQPPLLRPIEQGTLVDSVLPIAKLDTSPVVHDDQTPEGRLLQDEDGTVRYLGETSGATFLDSLKRFMATIFPVAFHGTHPDSTSQEPGVTFLATLGRYQTFDSRPLQLPPVDPLWLPSRTDMTTMLRALRYFMQDGNGKFASGGILYFGDMNHAPPGPEPRQDSSSAAGRFEVTGGGGQHRGLAFFHTAFAIASQLTPTTLDPNMGGHVKREGHLGEAFFARARALIGNPLDVTLYSTSDIGVLALMAMYLAENNRRDAAYMYITTAMHIAVMHGVHRGWMTDEMGKRVFWTVYIMDRWLSCLMGRPPTILDDAIRLEMPKDTSGLPPTAGLHANIELARITGYIVHNSYRVSLNGQTADKVESYIHEALQLLSDWRAKLPLFLQMPDDAFSSDRAGCELHMAHGQLVILTIRPIFFMAVKKAVADRFMSYEWTIEDHPHISLIRDCSDAARRNLRLARWVTEISPGGKLLLPDLHHIYNAAIILLLHQIVFINLRTKDVSDIAFAIACFQREASLGSHYGIDCAKVLQDLSALVQWLRNLMFDFDNTTMNVPMPGEQILASLSDTVPTAMQPANTTAAEASHTTTAQFAPISPSGDLYQEFRTWIDSNDLLYYNNLLY